MKALVKYTTLNIVTNAKMPREETYEGKNEKDIIRKVRLINYVVNNEITLNKIN